MDWVDEEANTILRSRGDEMHTRIATDLRAAERRGMERAKILLVAEQRRFESAAAECREDKEFDREDEEHLTATVPDAP